MLSQMAQIQPRKINSIRIMAVITKFVNICVSCGDFFRIDKTFWIQT